ncbi:hypothetical protein LINGRAPRIM_LOCUS509, partial [Linum grandiflorum]
MEWIGPLFSLSWTIYMAPEWLQLGHMACRSTWHVAEIF